MGLFVNKFTTVPTSKGPGFETCWRQEQLPSDGSPTFKQKKKKKKKRTVTICKRFKEATISLCEGFLLVTFQD